MRVLIDRFDSTPEPDEPLHHNEVDMEPDEDLYEDPYDKDLDISPGPAPKLQGDLSKRPQTNNDASPVPPSVSSSVSPPQSRSKEETKLEGEQWINSGKFDEYISTPH